MACLSCSPAFDRRTTLAGKSICLILHPQNARLLLIPPPIRTVAFYSLSARPALVLVVPPIVHGIHEEQFARTSRRVPKMGLYPCSNPVVPVSTVFAPHYLRA